MYVKIEIKSDGYPMPDSPSVDEVIAARIGEQEAILNALEAEITKAEEKKLMMKDIVKEASRARNSSI